jgi:hypothetical protein
VTVLRVPYHLDEYLPDLDLPLDPARVSLPQPDAAFDIGEQQRHHAVGRPHLPIVASWPAVSGYDKRRRPLSSDLRFVPASA